MECKGEFVSEKIPFFSVVIPLYNKEKFIGRAINSVLNQTIQNFELIIVDDGSTDNSLNLVKAYDDNRIRLISQENQGVSIARNTGILNAKADYIAFLDADDEWLLDFLETIEQLINDFPLAGGYSTSALWEDQYGDLIPITFSVLPKAPWQGEISNLFHVIANDASPIIPSSACIKRSVFANVGMFPEGIKRGEDIDTWIRISLKYNIAFSTKLKVIKYNDYGGGSTVLAGITEENLYAFLELEKKISANEIPDKLIKDAKKTMSRLLGWEIDSCILHEEYFFALKYIFDARMGALPMKRSKLLLKLLVRFLVGSLKNIHKRILSNV